MSCIGGDLSDNGVSVNAVTNAGITDPIGSTTGYPIICSFVVSSEIKSVAVGKGFDTYYGYSTQAVLDMGSFVSGTVQLDSRRANRLPTLANVYEYDTGDTFNFGVGTSVNTGFKTVRITQASNASNVENYVKSSAASFSGNIWVWSSVVEGVMKDSSGGNVNVELRAD